MNYIANARKMRPIMEQAVQSLSDETALTVVELYPAWAEGTAYGAAYKVRHGGGLYRCLQAHTAQVSWEPENAPALWEQICETHAGTLNDPIPYSGNMALMAGKYYIQAGVIYLCTRDTGNPVYNALRELVGIYLEEV